MTTAGLKKVAKQIIPSAFLLERRAKMALQDHEAQKHLWRHMDQALMDETKLLSDRYMMLDRLPKNAVVAEIGVAQGNFSREILARTSPARLCLIDLWDAEDERYSQTAYDGIQSALADEIKNGVVELHRGFSAPTLAGFPADTFDWVYVDAGHDYENARQDLESAFKVVKSGGLICGHDYVRWAGVADRYGVVEAVNEFAHRTRAKLIYLTNQYDKHDSFCLQLEK